MAFSVGIVIYDRFSLLDLAGPFDVLARASNSMDGQVSLFEQSTVGRSKEVVTSVGGIQLMPQHIYPDAHVYDVLLVPGGPGSRKATKNLRLINWFSHVARLAKIVASVGSGVRILAAAGLLTDRAADLLLEPDSQNTAAEVTAQASLVKVGKIIMVSQSGYGPDLGREIISELLGENFAEDAPGV